MAFESWPEQGVSLQGIAVAALKEILQGQGGPAFQFTAEEQRIEAGRRGVSARYDEPLFEGRLVDGDVLLKSGGGGLLQIRPHHQRARHLLIPQSLNLLLSQQWAGLGLMSLHAAVIQVGAHGVLALGNQGSGKSVLATAALSGGNAVVSDDWVILGAHDLGHVAERLRSFIMLRPGWAADRLLPDLPRQTNSAGKLVFDIREDDSRFPVSHPIHQIWLLKRPRTVRSNISTATFASAHQGLAQLITAGMPLLFSDSFPHERKALLAMLQGLLATAPVKHVETGTDLVTQPAETLRRLIET
ncbi:MAG: hypothetical protein ACXIUM_01525 [Wenzhouxiangella sp.]